MGKGKAEREKARGGGEKLNRAAVVEEDGSRKRRER